MRTTKKLFKKFASAIVAAATLITLAAPQSLVAFAAEESSRDELTTTDYNEYYYNSYEEGKAATLEIRKENEAQDREDGFINDAGEVVEEPKFDTRTTAIDYIRRCFVERRSAFVFQMKSSINSNSALSKEWDDLMESVLAETPNGYEGDYLFYHYADSEVHAYRYPNGYWKYYVYPDYHTTKRQEAEVTKKIENLKATTFKDYTTHSDYYNIRKVYKWVCDNFSYDDVYEDHTAYGGLINKRTVCQGYATATYRLLKEMGVNNRIVASWFNTYKKNSKGQYIYSGHGWNIVKIGSKYYNLDTTWGDGGITNRNVTGKYDDRFFLKTDSSIKVADKSPNDSRTHTRGVFKGRDYTSKSFYSKYPMATSNYKTTGSENKTISYPNVGVTYKSQRQTYGWETKAASNGATSGTVGQGKRLEAIVIKLNNTGNLDIGIEYKTHIQSYGWTAYWSKNGNISGTVGQGKRLEAIMIRLTGDDAAKYDVYYRVHAQTYGWLGWAKNGESAGTAGQGKRLEAIQIKIVKKGAAAPKGTIGYSYVDYGKTSQVNDYNSGLINYRTHVQSYGWQNYVCDGSLSGTYGEGKRLEAIQIDLGTTGYTGKVEYRTHIQSFGWEKSWKSYGATSGTSGKGKRLEAIQIRLSGEVATKYDVYYRVHAQSFGWLGWAKNGASAGTEGYAKRLEGIQIVLVKKGSGAPSASANKAFIKK